MQQLFHLIPTEKEQVVTFQVALMASNGVVLASDTSRSTVGELRVTSSNVFKIDFDNDLGIAYMFSGDDSARYAGKFLMSELRNGTPVNEELFDRASKKGYKNYKRDLKALSGMSKLLYKEALSPCRITVAKSENNTPPKFVLWYADFYGGTLRDVQIVPISGNGGGVVFGGDRANPAMFIVEHYYTKGTIRAMDAVVTLAAHAVLAAPRHGGGINGLDIVCGENGKFERVSDSENALIQKRVSDLEEYTHRAYTERSTL